MLTKVTIQIAVIVCVLTGCAISKDSTVNAPYNATTDSVVNGAVVRYQIPAMHSELLREIARRPNTRVPIDEAQSITLGQPPASRIGFEGMKTYSSGQNTFKTGPQWSIASMGLGLSISHRIRIIKAESLANIGKGRVSVRYAFRWIQGTSSAGYLRVYCTDGSVRNGVETNILDVRSNTSARLDLGDYRDNYQWREQTLSLVTDRLDLELCKSDLFVEFIGGDFKSVHLLDAVVHFLTE